MYVHPRRFFEQMYVVFTRLGFLLIKVNPLSSVYFKRVFIAGSGSILFFYYFNMQVNFKIWKIASPVYLSLQ